MDLDSFLVSLYVLTENWWKANRSPKPSKPGRPALLCQSEVLTLAILAQWPRFRSERDFWRFARAHLRCYFPALCCQSQFNRRVRALEGEMRALQRHLSKVLVQPSTVYHVLDTTLIPMMMRVRACRKGLFAGQATFGRCRSKTEWVYGFKVALSVSPEGVVLAFGLAPASCDERLIGDFLLCEDRYEAYLWPTRASLRWNGRSAGWSAMGRWWRQLPKTTPGGHGRKQIAAGLASLGKRQIIEGVIDQLKDFFALERHRAKTLQGLLARLAAKIAAYPCGQHLNVQLGRPLRHLADLLV